jgi:hypothetical protein
MHRGGLRTMSGNSDESHQSLGASFGQRLESTALAEGGLPFCLFNQIV